MQLAMKRDAGSNKKRDTRQRGRYTRNEVENIRVLLATDREVDAAAPLWISTGSGVRLGDPAVSAVILRRVRVRAAGSMCRRLGQWVG